MANNFNNSGVSGVSTNSSSPTTVYTSNNGSPIKSIIVELDIANTGTSAITASAILYDSSATAEYHIVKNAPLPSGSTLKVISGQKVVLQEDDEIRVYASATTADVIVSVLEDVA